MFVWDLGRCRPSRRNIIGSVAIHRCCCSAAPTARVLSRQLRPPPSHFYNPIPLPRYFHCPLSIIPFRYFIYPFLCPSLPVLSCPDTLSFLSFSPPFPCRSISTHPFALSHTGRTGFCPSSPFLTSTALDHLLGYNHNPRSCLSQSSQLFSPTAPQPVSFTPLCQKPRFFHSVFLAWPLLFPRLSWRELSSARSELPST